MYAGAGLFRDYPEVKIKLALTLIRLRQPQDCNNRELQWEQFSFNLSLNSVYSLPFLAPFLHVPKSDRLTAYAATPR